MKTIKKAAVRNHDCSSEFETPERLFIAEVSNSDADTEVSIARARVPAGITTQLHRLNGTNERYLITSGRGRVMLGGLPPGDVAPGDVILIPSGCVQQISNTGSEDLVFYCMCTPPYKREAYESLEDDSD